MLRQRFVTVVVLLIPLFAVVFLLPRLAAVFLLAALVLGGAWEWTQFFAPRATAVRAAYVAVVGALLAALWFWTASGDTLQLVLVAAVAWWLVALGWIVAWPTPVPRWVGPAAGLIALAPAWLALARLHHDAGRGPELLILMFAVVWAADTGAYFAGRLFGRVKLAPKVSPGKTWEGVLGGLAASGLVALAGAWWFGYPPLSMVALAVAVALISIVGDLTVSLFKRHAGLKDSGRLFPGHGGILDRIDSIAAGAPLFVLGLGWLGAGL